jgi:hypothetical protein
LAPIHSTKPPYAAGAESTAPVEHQHTPAHRHLKCLSRRKYNSMIHAREQSATPLSSAQEDVDTSGLNVARKRTAAPRIAPYPHPCRADRPPTSITWARQKLCNPDMVRLAERSWTRAPLNNVYGGC